MGTISVLTGPSLLSMGRSNDIIGLIGLDTELAVELSKSSCWLSAHSCALSRCCDIILGRRGVGARRVGIGLSLLGRRIVTGSIIGICFGLSASASASKALSVLIATHGVQSAEAMNVCLCAEGVTVVTGRLGKAECLCWWRVTRERLVVWSLRGDRRNLGELFEGPTFSIGLASNEDAKESFVLMTVRNSPFSS